MYCYDHSQTFQVKKFFIPGEQEIFFLFRIILRPINPPPSAVSTLLLPTVNSCHCWFCEYQRYNLHAFAAALSANDCTTGIAVICKERECDEDGKGDL